LAPGTGWHYLEETHEDSYALPRGMLLMMMMRVIGLSRTVCEINGDFRRKSYEIVNFSTPCVFNAPTEGVPLELGNGAGSEETRMMELPEGRKSFKIGLAVLIQYRRVTDTQPSSHVAVASTR